MSVDCGNESDISAYAEYDFNSDDEPPCDEELAAKLVTDDGAVYKRIVQIGKNFNKPGRGDEVCVDILELEDDDVKKIFELNDVNGRNDAYTPIGGVSWRTRLKELLESAVKFSSIIIASEESRATFPRAVEEALRTMKEDEVALVYIVSGKEGGYATIKQRENENVIPVEKQLCELDQAAKMGICFSDESDYRSQQKRRLRAERKLAKRLDSLGAEALSATRSELRYLVRLAKFRHLTALTEDRQILKYVISQSPPYLPRLRERDGALFTVTLLEASVNPKCIQRKFVVEQLNRDLLWTPLRIALQSMREQEVAEVDIHVSNTEAYEAQRNSSAAWGEILPPSRERVKLQLVVTAVKQVDNFELSGSLLKYVTVLHPAFGVRQQMSIDAGCSILCCITLRSLRMENLGMPLEDGKHGPMFVSWTVGSGAVPLWLDTFVRRLKCRQRSFCILPTTLNEDRLIAPFVGDEELQTIRKKETAGGSAAAIDIGSALAAVRYSLLTQDEAKQWELKFADCDQAPQHKCHEALEISNAAGVYRSDESNNRCPFLDAPSDADLHTSKASNKLIRGVTPLQNYLSIWSAGDGCSILERRVGSNLWSSKRCTPEQSTQLIDWIHQNFAVENRGSSRIDWKKGFSNDESVIVDIQLIELLRREAPPWMLAHTERMIHADYRKILGNALLRRRLYFDAEIQYREAIRILGFAPSEDTPHFKMGVTNETKRTEDLDPDAEAEVNSLLTSLRANLTLALLKSGNYRECLKTGNEALLKDPVNPKILFRCAQAAFALQNLKQAEEYALRSAEATEDVQMLAEIRKFLDNVARVHRNCLSAEKQMFGGIFSSQKKHLNPVNPAKSNLH